MSFYLIISFIASIPLSLKKNRSYKYRYVCFIPWPTPWNWQWGAVKNETLRQKRLFKLSHFPCICNIPAAPAYGVYISQLKRYSRVCGSYQDFLDKGLVAANKEATESSWLSWSHHFESFTITNHDLVDRYGISVSQMTTNMFHLS